MLHEAHFLYLGKNFMNYRSSNLKPTKEVIVLTSASHLQIYTGMYINGSKLDYGLPFYLHDASNLIKLSIMLELLNAVSSDKIRDMRQNIHPVLYTQLYCQCLMQQTT